MARTVLVTGAAGFIGAALSQRLLQQGDRVVGLDNLNDYYDPSLKQARLRQIEAVAPEGAWRFVEMALEDGDALMALVRCREADSGGQLGGSGRGSLLPGESGGLHPEQSCGLWPSAGRLPPPRHRKPRLRLEQFGVWRKPQSAFP